MYLTLFNFLINKKTLLFLFLVSIHISSINAQSIISTSDILKASFETRQVKFDSSRVSLLNEYNYNLPLIKSVQLRTESRDLLLERQEYSLRIKPNSIRAMSRQNEINKNRLEVVEIENQLHLSFELKRRYLLIIDYLFNKKMIELFDEKQDQLNDKLIILSESIYDTNFDVKDLIETEEGLFTTRLRIKTLKKENSHYHKMLNQSLKNQLDSLSIATNNLIAPQQIIDFNTQDSISSENLSIKLQNLKLNTLENEMELSVAKSNQFLDYVQAKYGGKNSFLFNENFSIGVGINLPFFGNSRVRKGTFYFNKLSEESKLINITEKHKESQSLVQDEFNIAVTNYQTLLNQNEQSSVNTVYDTYRKMEGVSPLLLLKLKILQQKKKIEIIKSEHNLYKSYIKLLDVNDILIQRPLRDYLSSELAPINLTD